MEKGKEEDKFTIVKGIGKNRRHIKLWVVSCRIFQLTSSVHVPSIILYC